jgi:hypothetical protein
MTGTGMESSTRSKSEPLDPLVICSDDERGWFGSLLEMVTSPCKAERQEDEYNNIDPTNVKCPSAGIHSYNHACTAIYLHYIG